MDITKHRNDRNSTFNELRKRATEELSSAKTLLARKRHEKIRLNLKKEMHTYNKVRRQANTSSAREALDAITERSGVHETFDAKNAPPSGVQWVRARSNIRLPEGFEPSFFIPYVDEKEENILSSSVVADELYEADSDHDDDSDVEGKETSDDTGDGGVRDRRHGSRMMRFGRRKIGELRWDRAAKRIALHRMSQHVDDLSSDVFIKAVSKAFNLSKSVYVKHYLELIHTRYEAWMKKKKDDIQLENSRREVSKLLLGHGEVTAFDALQGDSITFFFCRQCYVYNCSLHGQQVSGPTCSIPDKTRRDSASRQVSDEIQLNCASRISEECWHAAPSNSISGSEANLWWSDFENSSSTYAKDVKVLLKDLLPIFGEDFCRVSEVLRIMLRGSQNVDVFTCKRIGYVAKKSFPNLLVKPESSRSKPGKYRASNPLTECKAMNGGKRPDFFPCRHDGPCSLKNCTCVQTGVHCEKYCGCNHNRPNQSRNAAQCYWAFKGCSCRSALACVSKACICFSWKRECDPDLCKACHDCKISEGGVHSFSCRNVGLQHKKGRRTVAGRSDVHGWGIFATLDIVRNELVGEYVGEVIEDQEAERRGRVYDLLNSNFLFDITTNYSLDSSRIGNKLRYCNHSSDPNCEPRLMRVGGDIRIGIFAKRDIRQYEELFFDYGPNFVKKLAMKEKVGTAKKVKASNVHHADLLDGDDDDSGDDSSDDNDGEIGTVDNDKVGIKTGKRMVREPGYFSKSVPLKETRRRVSNKKKAVSKVVRGNLRNKSGDRPSAFKKSGENALNFDSRVKISSDEEAVQIQDNVKVETDSDSGIENGSSYDKAFASQMSDTGGKGQMMLRKLSLAANGAHSDGISTSLRNGDNDEKRYSNHFVSSDKGANGKPPRDVNKAPCKQENSTRARDGKDDDADGGLEDGIRPCTKIGRSISAVRTVEEKDGRRSSNNSKKAGTSSKAEQAQQPSKRQLFIDVDLRRPSALMRTIPDIAARYNKSRENQRYHDRHSFGDSATEHEHPSMNDRQDRSGRVFETSMSRGEKSSDWTPTKHRTEEEFGKPGSRMSTRTNAQGDFSKRLKDLRRGESICSSENRFDTRSFQNEIASQCSVDSRSAAVLRAPEPELPLVRHNVPLSEIRPHRHASWHSLGQHSGRPDKPVDNNPDSFTAIQTKLSVNRFGSLDDKSGDALEAHNISARPRLISCKQEHLSPDDLAETPAPTICSARTDDNTQFTGCVANHPADSDIHCENAAIGDAAVLTDDSSAVEEVEVSLKGYRAPTVNLTNEVQLPSLKRKLGCPGGSRETPCEDFRSSKRFKVSSEGGAESSRKCQAHATSLLNPDTRPHSDERKYSSKNRSYFLGPRSPSFSTASRAPTSNGGKTDFHGYDEFTPARIDFFRGTPRRDQERKPFNPSVIDVTGEDNNNITTKDISQSATFKRPLKECHPSGFVIPGSRFTGRRNSGREGRYNLPPMASDLVMISSLSGAEESSGQDLQEELIKPINFLTADEDDGLGRNRRH